MCSVRVQAEDVLPPSPSPVRWRCRARAVTATLLLQVKEVSERRDLFQRLGRTGWTMNLKPSLSPWPWTGKEPLRVLLQTCRWLSWGWTRKPSNWPCIGTCQQSALYLYYQRHAQ